MSEPARVPNDERSEPVSSAADAGAGPGAVLGEERRRQGLSLGDIARQLKLSVRQIEALERDDYAMFAGLVFVRGFLRNYAKLLQLDLEEAIARLPGAGAASSAPVAAEEAPAPTQSPRAARIPLGWLVGAGIFAVLVIAAIYEGRQHKGAPSQPVQPAGTLINPHPDSPPAGLASPSAPAQETPAASVDLALSASAAVAPAATAAAVRPGQPAPGPPPIADASLVADSARPQVASPIPAAPPGAAATPPAAPAAAPTAPPTPAATAAPTPSAEGPSAQTAAGQLRLKFDAEAWVEVKDASGKVLFSRLGSPGSEQSIQGRAPLQVVVGNAHAVQVTYQGRIVDLAPHTRIDVARLVLE
jgi:cytoskeleton protein RodZ